MPNLRRWKYFKCQQCGKCCEEIGLPYDPERISEMAKFINMSLDQMWEKYYGKIIQEGDKKLWESEDHKRTPCLFFKSTEGEKSCLIYPVRPKGCKLYPIDTDFGRGNVDCPAAKIVDEKIEQEDNS